MIIQVWNFQRCQIMQSLQRHSESEVTGIVSLSDNKVVTVGWNRLIVTYDCSNTEVIFLEYIYITLLIYIDILIY